MQSRANPVTMLWPVLGLVRFILALVVVFRHIPLARSGVLAWTDKVSSLGAVYGFLLISGYSIAESVGRDTNQFYFRRALRIYPLYALSIIACAVPFMWIPDIEYYPGAARYMPDYFDTVLNLCFCQGFLSLPVSSNIVVWSLSLEVFFYVIAPWLAKRSTVLIAVLIASSLVAFTNVRMIFLPAFPDMMFGGNVLFLGWAWILGFWVHRAGAANGAIVALGVGLIATAINRSGPGFAWPWAIAVAGIFYGSRMAFNAKAAKWCGYLGDVSYPLYLFHTPINIALYGSGAPASVCLYLGLAVAAACVLDRYYDRPIKWLVLRLTEKRRTNAPGLSANRIGSFATL